ncbi:MAG TPA: hypothetical protein VIM11_08055 [Tepidisphaeraceae bacterium]
MHRHSAVFVVVLWLATPVCAHRVDEYLQATTIDVATNRVVVQMRLTPGIEVFRVVVASIDTDGDGVLSEVEQRAYVERVLHDLSFSVDAKPVRLRLVSAAFPKVEQMKEGLGDIRLEFDAEVPKGGPNRTLVFENHHQRGIAAYLVNCLLPSDPAIHVTAQNRNFDQSFYRLDYTQAGIGSSRVPSGSWSTVQRWAGVDAIVVFVWIAIVVRRRFRGVSRSETERAI